jgi:hypothetical protein
LRFFIPDSFKRKLPCVYGAFKKIGGISALAFAQSRHRHPQNLKLMHRHLTLIPFTTSSFTLALRTLSPPLEFLPHFVRHTLKRLQFFMPAELSQRHHAALKPVKNIV